jgi:NAD(P)H dehydrogenase (quinone)
VENSVIRASSHQSPTFVHRAPLADGHPVRAVVRAADKGDGWAERGCEVALAEMNDTASLTAAFKGARGVFILPPSEFDPSPGFPEARAVIDAAKAALESALPDKGVCLSTIGAQASQLNLHTQRTLMEQALGTLSMPITFLRPGWFMENAAWDVVSARDSGVIHSFLQPLDKPVPMVATTDAGRVAAICSSDTEAAGVLSNSRDRGASLQTTWQQRSLKFSGVLFVRRPSPAKPGASSLNQGMKDPEPHIKMLDGFNEGRIEFERGEAGSIKGETEPAAVLRRLVKLAGWPGNSNATIAA